MSWRRLLAALLVIGSTTGAAWAQAPARIDTSTWTAYRNEAMSFELKHPASWRDRGAKAVGSEMVMLSGSSQTGAPALGIQVWIQRGMNPRGLSIEQWYADQLSRVSSPPKYPTTAIVIGGRPALRRAALGTQSRHFDVFAVIHKTDIFQVTISQPTSQADLDPTYAALLSTIKFLD